MKMLQNCPSTLARNKPWQYVRKQISDTLEVFGLLSLVLRLDVPTSVPPSPATRHNANARVVNAVSATRTRRKGTWITYLDDMQS